MMWMRAWRGNVVESIDTIIENRLSLPKCTESERKDCVVTSAAKTAMP
jgi:hypothetical protein